MLGMLGPYVFCYLDLEISILDQVKSSWLVLAYSYCTQIMLLYIKLYARRKQKQNSPVCSLFRVCRMVEQDGHYGLRPAMIMMIVNSGEGSIRNS